MQNQSELLREWYRRVAVTQYGHYLSAAHFGKRKFWLGIPAVMLSTLVGTSVFATVAGHPTIVLQIGVGLASVSAALLTSLQTFMNYTERAEKHRTAGAKYGAIGRQLEQMRSSQSNYDEAIIAQVRKRMDDLAIQSPDLSTKIYRRAGATDLAVIHGDSLKKG